MGKSKAAKAEALIEEEPVIDKKALKEAKKEAKKEERFKMKEMASALVSPTGPPDSMADAELVLTQLGVPAGLPRLTVDYAGRLLSASSSSFVKSKARMPVGAARRGFSLADGATTFPSEGVARARLPAREAAGLVGATGPIRGPTRPLADTRCAPRAGRSPVPARRAGLHVDA